MSERVYMMAVSTERLVSRVSRVSRVRWVCGHNIWYTESLIAGKVAKGGGCDSTGREWASSCYNGPGATGGCSQSSETRAGDGAEHSWAQGQLAAVMACLQLSSGHINNTHVHFIREEAPHHAWVERISKFISEEKSVPFARLVGAITTWINPQGETLTACCRAACSEIRGRDGVCSGWRKSLA